MWGVVAAAAGGEAVDVVDANRTRKCWILVGGNLARAERW